MVKVRFLRNLEIEVGGYRPNLTRLSASGFAFGVVVAAALEVVAAASFASAEAYCNIFSQLSQLWIEPHLRITTTVLHRLSGHIILAHIHPILLVPHDLKLITHHIWSVYLSKQLLLLFLPGSGVLLDRWLDLEFILQNRYHYTCVCVTYCMTLRLSPLPR
jgi:hypothetical protein